MNDEGLADVEAANTFVTQTSPRLRCSAASLRDTAWVKSSPRTLPVSKVRSARYVERPAPAVTTEEQVVLGTGRRPPRQARRSLSSAPLSRPRAHGSGACVGEHSPAVDLLFVDPVVPVKRRPGQCRRHRNYREWDGKHRKLLSEPSQRRAICPLTGHRCEAFSPICPGSRRAYGQRTDVAVIKAKIAAGILPHKRRSRMPSALCLRPVRRVRCSLRRAN